MLHQLGAGVLGPVYRASDPANGEAVAVKAFHLDLTPELADELADALERLVGAGLAHPGIVTPLAVGCEGSVPYLAQEYVAAESLDVAMRHYAPAAAERAMPLLHQLAGAVDAAHDAGVLHGSLHLRDVFVSPEEARATGFGVARALADVGLRAPVRRPYAAPEVVDGTDWGAEADRYAVAAIAYELLTGRRATGSGDEIIERLGSIYVGDEGALPALRDAFSWGLSEEPADRPGRAVELVASLAAALGVEVIEPEPIDAAARTVHPAASPTRPDRAGGGVLPVADEELDGEREASAAEGPEPGLPSSLRERRPGPRAADGHDADAHEAARVAAGPESDADLLEDLEPIEDEEPLSVGERVRGILQGTAAVLLGVLGAGVLYFLFAPETGVGGGDGAASDAQVAFGERSEPREIPEDPPLRTGDLDALPPEAPLGEPGGESQPPVGSFRPAEPQPSADSRAPRDFFAPARGDEIPLGNPAPTPPGAPAVQQASATAVPQVGWLLVRTSPPGATVTVEGVDRGRTPLSLQDVPYGTHRVGIEAPGYGFETREVTLSAAATVAALSVELVRSGVSPAAETRPPAPAEPATPPAPVIAGAGAGTTGSVFVESRPAGARVLIDGEHAGLTPIVVADLPPGRLEVRIEQDGYAPWVTVVEVPALDRVRVAASLDRARP
ncbi:MAG: PEGA domain-containing protein [Acidobacteria bacterium]|nr:PEGA domain-containing protein [Acidobacteriota bacterium]